jgi:hypothetical protein
VAALRESGIDTRLRTMPITDEQLRELRERYRVAYTAYMSCVDALTVLVSKREKAPAELMEKEAKALRELNEARCVPRRADRAGVR